jgi:NAD(P)H-nitrite reductase large subunit
MMTEISKYLIIGNSAGGIGAVEAIREVDRLGKITIMSEEPYLAYSRPLISEYLASRCPLERMLFRPADFYDQGAIQTVLGKKVTELDVDNHTIRLEDDSMITWQKLLLATGGLPIVPRMEWSGLQGVFKFIKLDDAKAIDEYLQQQHKTRMHAVVIGGGLIGISVTEALVKRGVEITIIEMKEKLLNTILDEEASNLEEVEIKQTGVEIITGHTVSRINSYLPGEVTGVTLDDGHYIPCDMVVIAIGVRPRIELAVAAGIGVNRGIVVDRQMNTTIADIYACGDVAEAYDFIYDTNRLTPIWPNAYMGGRIAGFNMAGKPALYQGGTTMNSMRYFGLNVVSAGMVIALDDTYEVISSMQDKDYKKIVLKDGLIMGMIVTGSIEKAGIIYNLMKDRIKVDNFKEALIDDQFGLVSLPEYIWRERLKMLSAEGTSSIETVEKLEEMTIRG